MRLLDVVRVIERESGLQPLVGTVVSGNVSHATGLNDIRWWCVGISEGVHRLTGLEEDTEVMEWGFSIFVADRVAEFGNGSGDNVLGIHSEAVRMLTDIVRGCVRAGLEVSGGLTFAPWRDRWLDDVAGVTVEVVFQTALDWTCTDFDEEERKGFERDNNVKYYK